MTARPLSFWTIVGPDHQPRMTKAVVEGFTEAMQHLFYQRCQVRRWTDVRLGDLRVREATRDEVAALHKDAEGLVGAEVGGRRFTLDDALLNSNIFWQELEAAKGTAAGANAEGVSP